jgi:hypothetical protein
MPIDGVVRRARAALGVVLAATVIVVGARVATSAAEVAPRAPLLEAPGCDSPPPPASQATVVSTDGSSAAAPITMFIPPTVFIRVDARGAPVALMTNTGCAPRPSDRVLIEIDPTHAIGAPAALAATAIAMAEPFMGNWTVPGGWHEI